MVRIGMNGKGVGWGPSPGDELHNDEINKFSVPLAIIMITIINY